MAKAPKTDTVDEPEAAPAEPAVRLFFADQGSVTEATTEEKAATLRLSGWRQIEQPEYEQILADKEAARLQAVEEAREAARQKAAQDAQDAAAQLPPESSALAGFDKLSAKSIDDRVTRIEFIMRSMGYPL